MKNTKKDLIDSFTNFDDHLLELLANPNAAKKYINLAIEEYAQDKDKQALLQAFANVMKAQVGSVANNIFVVQYPKKIKRV